MLHTAILFENVSSQLLFIFLGRVAAPIAPSRFTTSSMKKSGKTNPKKIRSNSKPSENINIQEHDEILNHQYMVNSYSNSNLNINNIPVSDFEESNYSNNYNTINSNSCNINTGNNNVASIDDNVNNSSHNDNGNSNKRSSNNDDNNDSNHDNNDNNNVNNNNNNNISEAAITSNDGAFPVYQMCGNFNRFYNEINNSTDIPDRRVLTNKQNNSIGNENNVQNHANQVIDRESINDENLSFDSSKNKSNAKVRHRTVQ